MGSHALDLFLRLNDGRPVEWVQFHVPSGGDLACGSLPRDPNSGGRLQFANGVAAFASDTGRAFEVEVVCEQAVINSLGADNQFLLRDAGRTNHRGHGAGSHAVTVASKLLCVSPARNAAAAGASHRLVSSRGSRSVSYGSP